ncbi:MAG TPA: GAF domain-containing protein [Solirubrobacterales bacterium]|nr:GAF domain-containing protein [Solirubrobacterales bacterium]
MTVKSEPGPEPRSSLRSAQRETETLYAVIQTVSSSLDLDQVLGGIVDITTDATGCHACFIYFLEAERLVLRAASPRYASFVGKLDLSVDEGLAGWVARTKTSEFIPDDAMSDPRMKYVPELEEERFQSMVAVPILAKSGSVIGVVVLHTAAPREFDDDVLNFLLNTASLVAGAIENAQLYEETRRRVQALTTLTELSQALAAITRREDLIETVTRGARELLGAGECQIYRLDAQADQLVLAGSDPKREAEPSPRPEGTSLVLDLMRRANGRGRGGDRRAARTLWPDVDEDALLLAPLVAGDEQLGIICCLANDRQFGPDDAELLAAVANQTAVGLKKSELIERLTAENLVKDMFDALAAGSVDAAEAKASEAGCDLSQPHLFMHVERVSRAPVEGRVWSALAARLREHLRRLGSRAFLDSRPDRLRALALLATGNGDAVERVRAACDPLGREAGLVVGLSEVDRGGTSARRRIREAADAARIGRSLTAEGGALSYEQLGAYRYLVHLELDQAPRDRYRQSVERLLEYDRRRNACLVDTLERFLADRGRITSTARAMFVHPNTIRQRLARIQRVADLDLSSEDLLSLELALKLVRLHEVRAEQEQEQER